MSWGGPFGARASGGRRWAPSLRLDLPKWGCTALKPSLMMSTSAQRGCCASWVSLTKERYASASGSGAVFSMSITLACSKRSGRSIDALPHKCRGMLRLSSPRAPCPGEHARSGGLSRSVRSSAAARFRQPDGTVGGYPCQASQEHIERSVPVPVYTQATGRTGGGTPIDANFFASLRWLNAHQHLAFLHQLPVLGWHCYHRSRHLGFDLVKDLHRFNDSHHLPGLHGIPDIDERIRGRRRRAVI